MLQYLRYRYAKTRMSAYVQGELDPRTRRTIARMIDQDPRCYAEYVRCSQIHRELEREVPLIGRADSAVLGSIWESIVQDLVPQPDISRQRRPFKFSYGVVMAAFSMLIFFSLVADVRSAQALRVPDHPLPDENIALSTPIGVTQVALAYDTDEVATTVMATVGLQNTPAPQTPSR